MESGNSLSYSEQVITSHKPKTG